MANSLSLKQCIVHKDMAGGLLSLKVPVGGVLPSEAVAWWKLLMGKPSWVSL